MSILKLTYRGVSNLDVSSTTVNVIQQNTIPIEVQLNTQYYKTLSATTIFNTTLPTGYNTKYTLTLQDSTRSSNKMLKVFVNNTNGSGSFLSIPFDFTNIPINNVIEVGCWIYVETDPIKDDYFNQIIFTNSTSQGQYNHTSWVTLKNTEGIKKIELNKWEYIYFRLYNTNSSLTTRIGITNRNSMRFSGTFYIDELIVYNVTNKYGTSNQYTNNVITGNLG